MSGRLRELANPVLQFDLVCRKTANAISQLLGGHGVFVQEKAECFLVEVEF